MPRPLHGPQGKQRTFLRKWQHGRPWLGYMEGDMHCIACRAYPQLGSPREWIDGTRNFRAGALKKHELFGPRNAALAMWVSGGKISSASGTLSPQVRMGVLTAFRGVYQGEKRAGHLADLPGDLSMVELSGGSVLPAYRLEFSARGILRAIALPFRNRQGTIILASELLALVSDSTTDRSAQKAELIYYRTMVEGKARTAYLSCQGLSSGTAAKTFSAYKRAFSAAGLEPAEWIAKLMWYCANGGAVMQGTREGVYALLRDLQ